MQDNIKQVPQSAEIREQIRAASKAKAMMLNAAISPDMGALRSLGESILQYFQLPHIYLGFAMVEISNAYWQERFASIPCDRRLLLLPQCLSDKDACRGSLDSIGLHCAACGACEILAIKTEAESLGYQVIVAEGTSSVLTTLLEGKADAVLGVACLDSLEKSHSRISQIGIPHVAVPLLTDGCVNTIAETIEIYRLMHTVKDVQASNYRSYLPLLRESYSIFNVESMERLLVSAGVGAQCFEVGADQDPMKSTECIALDWLLSGGKRLRPFVTLAAYCVGKYGQEIAGPDVNPADYIPDHIRSLAAAIEALHKASLVHDDIEDNEEFRYGRKTVQAEHGVSPAVNIGDYLVGLGYHLITSQTANIGADVTAKILSSLSKAHLDLCRGQGAEIMWKKLKGESLNTIDALSIYALKTAPAFEAALATGLYAARIDAGREEITRFCVYLGEAYQIENDLDDWSSDVHNHILAGGDILSGRPTVLRAFLGESGNLSALEEALAGHSPELHVKIAEKLLTELGIFAKVRTLRTKLRNRAIETARGIQDPNISSLLEFLVKVVIPERLR